MKALRHAALCLLLAASAPAGAETDPDSGFVIDDNWQLVRAHCTACHSAKIVTQNRGSRQTWLARIRWMQASQGLWQFDSATEGIILDYLEAHYGPGEGARRPPIPRDLMPENPYARSDVTAPSGAAKASHAN